MHVTNDNVVLMFLLGITYIVNVFLWIFFKGILEERKGVTPSIRSLFSTSPFVTVVSMAIWIWGFFIDTQSTLVMLIVCIVITIFIKSMWDRHIKNSHATHRQP